MFPRMPSGSPPPVYYPPPPNYSEPPQPQESTIHNLEASTHGSPSPTLTEQEIETFGMY